MDGLRHERFMQGHEVSCRSMAMFIELGKQRGVSAQALLDGTDLTVDIVLEASNRISWEQFCRFTENLARVWSSEQELRELGASLTRHRSLPFFALAGAMLLSPLQVYRWMARPGGGIALNFSCLRCTVTELDPDRIEFHIRLLDGLEAPDPYWVIFAGVLADLPCTLGLAPASVERVTDELEGRFVISLPPGRPALDPVGESTEPDTSRTDAFRGISEAYTKLDEKHQDLVEAERELRAQERWFRSLIEFSSDVKALVGPDRIFRYVSPSVRHVLGYEVHEFVGSDNEVLMHPDDRRTVARAFASLFTAPTASVTITFRSRHKRGHWVWVEGTARNLIGVEPLDAILLNLRDVSERVRLENQLLQSRKLGSLGRLAGGVAHDFNNLLTAIIAHASLATSELGDRHPVTERMRRITDEAERGASLVDNLLTFARSRSVQPSAIDINALVVQVIDFVRPLVPENISTRIRTLDEPVAAEMDWSALEQALINLVINACDAMPAGGELTISTERVELDHNQTDAYEHARPGTHVRICVSDTGVGMDEDVRTHAFDPFFTTKGDAGGSGLGLASAYGAVAQAGGFMTVESELGSGSRFSIYLRECGLADPDQAVPSIPDRRGAGQRIMLVEDSAPVRRVVAEALRTLGYEVVTATDGAEALERLRTFPAIDLLLTDLVMPKMGGVELAERIRERLPDLRVLYVSGYSQDTIDIPGDSFLQKPFTPDVLAAKVAKMLAKAGPSDDARTGD